MLICQRTQSYSSGEKYLEKVMLRKLVMDAFPYNTYDDITMMVMMTMVMMIIATTLAVIMKW